MRSLARNSENNNKAENVQEEEVESVAVAKKNNATTTTTTLNHARKLRKENDSSRWDITQRAVEKQQEEGEQRNGKLNANEKHIN